MGAQGGAGCVGIAGERRAQQIAVLARGDLAAEHDRGHLPYRRPWPGRADALAASLCRRFGAGRATGRASPPDGLLCDGIVNATPLGMAAHPGMAVPPALLEPGRWVAEVVYFPLETELLREARLRGCRTMTGGGMAVFQAVEAFRLFAGQAADAERMLRHFDRMD